MTSGQGAPGPVTASHALGRTVEGPVADNGDITFSGEYVGGHDVIVHNYGPLPDEERPPFLLVDREYLEEQGRKPKRIFVARSPDWADVVHGSDPALRFIERDQTDALHAAVRDELLAPLTRETDRQLHSLFVLGAPGAGKTTLVRRVAAMLAMADECVIADFGVKTERVASNDIVTYTRALDRLAAEGKPVLVLVDDPFFANSGWVEMLQALGRPQYQGVAVLGASPDFLFHRFAHWLFGKQVLGKKFEVSRPSVAEREQLALLHDHDPAKALTADEDLLVVAMEAAAGESFRDIMERIWITLNGGVPVDPATDIRRLPWPIVAFALICYFHRNYVLCPESLLHEFLSNVLDETPPSYLAHELQDLVTREGWRIFSVHTPAHGGPGERLIGATHARVAREAWHHRPLHRLDVEKGVLEAAVRVPAAVPQLAELILVNKAPQANQLAKKLAARWSTAKAQGTAETKTLCALVRELKPSRAARLNFRGVLRKCLIAEDDQSWLAAWQIYHLSSTTQHPQERKFLRTVHLPWTLKVADLSAGPPESIAIAERMGDDFKAIIVDRLTQSLRGELGWKADAQHVIWLLGNLPVNEEIELLELVYDWLEDDILVDDENCSPGSALVVEALVPVLKAGGMLDEDRLRLLGIVFDWLLTASEMNHGVLRALLESAEAAITEREPRGQVILAQLFELLCARPENNAAEWSALLALLARVPDLARDIVLEAFARLKERPESSEQVWSALLVLLGRVPALTDLARDIVLEAFARLKERPESSEQVWSALLVLLGRVPALTDLARDIVLEAFARLKERPESSEQAWSALLASLGRVPALTDLARDIVLEAFTRLKERPESSDHVWTALLASLTCVPDLARDIALEAFTRLKERPESSDHVWTALLASLTCVPDLARDIASEAFTRLKERPESSDHVWSALLGSLGRVPALTDLARDIVLEAFTRLKERPESSDHVWSALLASLTCVPDLARDIALEAFTRLKERPESSDHVWSALLASLTCVPDLARDIASEAFTRLKERPESSDHVWSALLGSLGRVPALTDLARDIVLEAFTRLKKRPNRNRFAWNALFSALGRVPELAALARDILPSAFAWLKERPESNDHVWTALLGSLGRVPALTDLARDILPSAFAWLKERPESNDHLWAALLGSLARVPDLARDIVLEAFARLKERPESSEQVWSALLVLLGRVPALTDLARDIVLEAFARLKERPESSEQVWSALLVLLGRVPALTDLARDIVLEAFTRLKERPESSDHVWSALLVLLGRVPALTDLARDIVLEAFARLRARSGPAKGAWLSLLLALSSPIDVTAGQRAEMLNSLSTWYGADLPANSYILRGVRLLQLAGEAHPELVQTVETELAYLEGNPALKPPHGLTQPMAYAVARTGRVDLEARFTAWERRSLGSHEDQDSAVAFPGVIESAT